MHVIMHESKITVVSADMNTILLYFCEPKNPRCMVRHAFPSSRYLPLLFVVVVVVALLHIPKKWIIQTLNTQNAL